MIKIRAVMKRMFSYSGRCTEISLKFYGQSRLFGSFVRNRHFSGRPFTDKLPIFIDLSVNGSDFEFVLLSRSRALNFDKPVDKKEVKSQFVCKIFFPRHQLCRGCHCIHVCAPALLKELSRVRLCAPRRGSLDSSGKSATSHAALSFCCSSANFLSSATVLELDINV